MVKKDKYANLVNKMGYTTYYVNKMKSLTSYYKKKKYLHKLVKQYVNYGNNLHILKQLGGGGGQERKKKVKEGKKATTERKRNATKRKNEAKAKAPKDVTASDKANTPEDAKASDTEEVMNLFLKFNTGIAKLDTDNTTYMEAMKDMIEKLRDYGKITQKSMNDAEQARIEKENEAKQKQNEEEERRKNEKNVHEKSLTNYLERYELAYELCKKCEIYYKFIKDIYEIVHKDKTKAKNMIVQSIKYNERKDIVTNTKYTQELKKKLKDFIEKGQREILILHDQTSKPIKKPQGNVMRMAAEYNAAAAQKEADNLRRKKQKAQRKKNKAKAKAEKDNRPAWNSSKTPTIRIGVGGAKTILQEIQVKVSINTINTYISNIEEDVDLVNNFEKLNLILTDILHRMKGCACNSACTEDNNSYIASWCYIESANKCQVKDKKLTWDGAKYCNAATFYNNMFKDKHIQETHVMWDAVKGYYNGRWPYASSDISKLLCSDDKSITNRNLKLGYDKDKCFPKLTVREYVEEVYKKNYHNTIDEFKKLTIG